MRRTLVLGPAYLDRVLRVEGPLLGHEGPTLDQSVDGTHELGEGLRLVDASGHQLVLEPPPGWPGPWGTIRLAAPIFPEGQGGRHHVRGVDWHDDLGGMGAGYAAALGGQLISALGPPDDPISQAVEQLLARYDIEHAPRRVAGQVADWTLLLTSGASGDKLAIGFRGCHARLETPGEAWEGPCDVRVVAAVPNRLASPAFLAPTTRARAFAPSLRNLRDRDVPLVSFAGNIDILACNRHEWESLADRDRVGEVVPIVSVTDGPRGSWVQFRSEDGTNRRVRREAFPRDYPPRDTNRAGEAYASTLLASLLDRGWTAGPAGEALVRGAVERASAAAALVLDRSRFGFPTAAEIDAALAAGRVADNPV